MMGSCRREVTVTRGHLSVQRRAEHLMGMPAVSRRWSAREVRALIAENPRLTPRYELVDGELLVTPSPSREHQRAVGELYFALRLFLGDERYAEVYMSPSDVELEPEFLSQPDVFVVPPSERRRKDDNVWRKLLLAAEVLSPSSSRHDRVRKRPKYQAHVPEYWIVDLASRLFERWTPRDERSEILTEQIEWRPEGAPEAFSLDLPAFFARVLDLGPLRTRDAAS